MQLATDTYRATAEFPKHELYGLAQQMRRAAVSIPSNIAEGKGRRTDREFRQFLFNARGSLMELETQLAIAGHMQYLAEKHLKLLEEEATNVGRALSGLIKVVEAAGQSSRMADDGQRIADV
jgi:four helix bundle protein